MDTELVDLDFGTEPPLAAPATRLPAARRALRRRRLAVGAGAAVCMTALGGFAWVAVGPLGGLPGTAQYAGSPSATASVHTGDLDVVAPDDCLGEVCVELVPHGMAPLSPARPGGDLAVGYRDGRLVKYWPEVGVVQVIEDPTSTGALQSAAVEVEFRGTRFRVALAEGFGYRVDQVEPGDHRTLGEWFAAQRRLPSNDCAVEASLRNDVAAGDSPGPGECWVEVDGHGHVLATPGVTLDRTFTPDLPADALPPGVAVTGVELTRGGSRYYGVVHRIGKDSFVSTTLVRAADVPDLTAAQWVRRNVALTSTSGVPDRDWPDPAADLRWWNPATNAFAVPDHVSLIRKVANPLHRTAPADSAGVIFDFHGKRYWALTEVTHPPAAKDEPRNVGVTITAIAGAASGADGDPSLDFDTWLAREVVERGPEPEGAR